MSEAISYRADWRLDTAPDYTPQPTNDALTRRMEAAGYTWDESVWFRVISRRVRTSRAGVRYVETVTRYVSEDRTASVRRTRKEVVNG